MGKKTYKDKFYNRKIASIVFSTLVLETFWVFAAAFLWYWIDSDILYSDPGYFIIFGPMGAWIVFTLIRANRLCAQRAQDELATQALSKNFMKIRLRNSLIVGAVLEVLLIALFIFLSDVGAPDPVKIVFILTMLGVVFAQIAYNSKIKNLRDRRTAGESFAENAIYWSDELRNTVVSSVIQILFGGLVTVFLWVEAKEEECAIATLVVTAVTLVVMICKILSLRKLADEEAAERWRRKKEEDKAAAAAAERKAAEEKAQAAQKEAERKTAQRLGPAPQYTDCHSISALCEEFVRYASENEVPVSVENAKEIFAAMAASRAVWLRHENLGYAKQVAALLQRFFTDFDGAVFVDAAANAPAALFQSGNWEDGRIAALLEKQLYLAKERTDSVNVFLFDVAEYKSFNDVFVSFIEGFRAPEGENTIRMNYSYAYADKGGAETSLPANIWCVFTARVSDELPAGASEYASAVRLVYTDKEFSHRAPKKKERVLSYSRFNELVSEAAQESFLSLEVWKKFDRIEEYLQEKTAFAITNPLARRLEGYSSVLLACGTPVTEVVDRMLANRLLPLLSGCEKEDLDREGNTFFALLDGLFGMDNIPLSQKLLSDRNWM